MPEDLNHPFIVAARRIACLASNGRGITVEEAEKYIRDECAALEADKARLDWFDATLPKIHALEDLKGSRHYSIVHSSFDGWRTLRGAIDAARKRQT